MTWVQSLFSDNNPKLISMRPGKQPYREYAALHYRSFSKKDVPLRVKRLQIAILLSLYSQKTNFVLETMFSDAPHDAKEVCNWIRENKPEVFNRSTTLQYIQRTLSVAKSSLVTDDDLLGNKSFRTLYKIASHEKPKKKKKSQEKEDEFIAGEELCDCKHCQGGLFCVDVFSTFSSEKQKKCVQYFESGDFKHFLSSEFVRCKELFIEDEE